MNRIGEQKLFRLQPALWAYINIDADSHHQNSKTIIVSCPLSTEYAGVVELADTLDLGTVTSVKGYTINNTK